MAWVFAGLLGMTPVSKALNWVSMKIDGHIWRKMEIDSASDSEMFQAMINVVSEDTLKKDSPLLTARLVSESTPEILAEAKQYDSSSTVKLELRTANSSATSAPVLITLPAKLYDDNCRQTAILTTLLSCADQLSPFKYHIPASRIVKITGLPEPTDMTKNAAKIDATIGESIRVQLRGIDLYLAGFQGERIAGGITSHAFVNCSLPTSHAGGELHILKTQDSHKKENNRFRFQGGNRWRHNAL